MSNKSGTSSQVISLPKGGGALQGMGETFSPDLHTGTGNFTVLIALPPGRNGFQPQLNLIYSTGNGNGPFGMGWSLSIPGVSRKTSMGVPRYDDPGDVFILSGSEDLVPVEVLSTKTETRYHPRTEGLFARIEHHHDAKKLDDYWEVRSKDGLISLYGTPGKARTDPAVVSDPSKRKKIFSWGLTQTTDPFENRIEYEYLPRSGTDQLYAEPLYPSRIRYADYTDQNKKTKFLVSVEFEYEDLPAARRIYPFSDYRSGFEIRTGKRCKRIVLRTHAGKERLARTYELVYLDGLVTETEERLTELKRLLQSDPQNATVRARRDATSAKLEKLGSVLPLNGASLLSRIKVIGHNDSGERAEELPPLEFGYTSFEPEKRDFFPLRGRDLPARSLANPDTELVDLFGNGLPDIFETNGTARYWRNRGNGEFDLPREMRDAPAGLRLADPGVQMIDADGDGRTDLLVTTNGLSGYYPLRFGALWDRRSFQRFEVAPSFNLEDPEVKLVELDGDGLTDVVRSGSRLECFFNNNRDDGNGQHKGWTPEKTRWVERRALEVFPNVNFSDPRVKWADMSGDGLQDIVLVHDGNVEYWPNLGHGDWGRRVCMRDSPRFPYGYDPKRILVGDVDGDGAADIVYVDDTRVTLWINRSGRGFNDPITILGTPPVSDMDAVRLVDMLGTGINGLLWSADAGGLSHEHMFFLDFTGGTKPYLLSEMDNHMGAVTRVGYAPSTRFYLDDEKRPETRWKTPLPFPVQVVARVETVDEISRGKLTTEYCYHHGYWDGADREFRGFGMVEQRDTEVFDEYNAPGLHDEGMAFAKVEYDTHFSPPTLTKTWFHQGPVGDEFGEWGETKFGTEFWPDDLQVFSADDPTDNRLILSRPPSMTNFLKQLPRRVKRDALRALRGCVLRTELYALDGAKGPEGEELEKRPYTVTESLHGVCEVVFENGQHELTCEPRPGDSPRVAGDRLPQRIFFPHTLAQRTTQWERGDDPMKQFGFTEDYDEFGQPRKQTQIACPRGWRNTDASATKEYLATYSETTFAQRDDDKRYIVDRVANMTSYEVEIDQKMTVPGLKKVILDGSAKRHAIGQTLNFYDGKPFTGLPSGRIGKHGALCRTETLVLDEDVLQKAYGDKVPPYLAPDASPAFTADYPQDFRDSLPIDNPSDPTRPNLTITPVGYGFADGNQDSPFERGYFMATERRAYDFHDDPEGRGLLTATRDPLGRGLPGSGTSRETSIAYDDFDLLPMEVVMPKGTTGSAELKTEAVYDYRVLKPAQVIDPNGNRTRFTFTALGLLKDTWVLGKPANNEGDRQRPGIRMEYDFLAFENSPPEDRQPISVRTVRQVHHDTEADISLPRRDETITTVEYSDGIGRLLQTRTQAEDMIFSMVDPVSGKRDDTFGNQVLSADQPDSGGHVVGHPVADPAMKPRIVVSGWQIYDNKGRVVEKYEPFFSEGWDYSLPEDSQLGQKATMFYDPRGRVIRTLNPDGSEQRVVQGVPGTIASPDLTDPDVFDPTPWEAYTYDANDNAGRTHDAVLFEIGSGFQSDLDTGVLSAVLRDEFGKNGVSLPAGATLKVDEPGALWLVVVGDGIYPIRKMGDELSVSGYLSNVQRYRHHWDTPASVVVDALGRTVEVVERNRAKPARIADSLPPIEEYRTSSTYDIRGNLLTVTDALGRVAFKHVYDLANEPLRIESIDAGIRLTVLDAAGNVAEGRDSKGALTLHAYDKLTRPIRLWACDRSGQPLTLREKLVYGDDASSGLTPTQIAVRNLIGKLYQHYDEAGLLTAAVYDFKGNLLERGRRVIADSAILAAFNSPAPARETKAFRVNWQPAHAPLLDVPKNEYTTMSAYDALNRIKTIQFPDDAKGGHSKLRPTYNRAGALERIELERSKSGGTTHVDTYVEHIAYNAKGQRTLIAYGNHVMTRYAYDEATFRLVRMCTERYETQPSTAHTYRPASSHKPLQDFAYAYDLAGNIMTIHDRTPASGIPSTPLGADALDRVFGYDPLYRLVSATGRECDTPPPQKPWDDTFRCHDATRTRAYTQEYTYDPAWNMTLLHHQAGAATSFNRSFTFAGGHNPVPTNNRLDSVTSAATPYAYTYDDNGNLIKENTQRHLRWDHADRMISFENRPAGGSLASVEACYLYGADGMRIKKWVRTNGTGDGESTVFIDGVFEHHRWKETGQPGTKQNNRLHVIDGQTRIAIVRIGDIHMDDAGPDVRYQLGDHLGSSNLIVGGGTATVSTFINREEYFPYGETSFGSFARKRYRFTGRERDEESGLCYHGARYYAPWLARWVSCDPAGMVDGLNLYAYAAANPVWRTDPTGMDSGDTGILRQESLPGGTAPTADEATGTREPTEFVNDPVAGTVERPASPLKINPESLSVTLLGKTLEWNLNASKWDTLTGEDFMQMTLREMRTVIAETTTAEGIASRTTVQYMPDYPGPLSLDVRMNLSLPSVEAYETNSANWRIITEFFRQLASYWTRVIPGRTISPSETSRPVYRSPNEVGALREAYVARQVGGVVMKRPNGQDYVLKVPGIPGQSLKLDVVGFYGELILVGGPGKAVNMSKTIESLIQLQRYSAYYNARPMSFFERGTSTSLLKRAGEILGPENVQTFSLPRR